MKTDESNIDSRYDRAKNEYRSGNFDQAKLLLDQVIAERPSSPRAMAAHYLRGRGFEDGRFSQGLNLDKALEDYLALLSGGTIARNRALVGCARVLYTKDREANMGKILELCLQAVNEFSNPKAMMWLGVLHETTIKDSALAAKWYLSAYRRGLPWGMRYYARLQEKEGRTVRSLLAHLLATASSPLLVLLNGQRSEFK